MPDCASTARRLQCSITPTIHLNVAAYDKRSVSIPGDATLRRPVYADRSWVLLKPFKGELQCLPQPASPTQDPVTDPLPLSARPLWSILRCRAAGPTVPLPGECSTVCWKRRG